MELKIVKFFNRLGQGTIVDKMTVAVSNIFFLAGFWTSLTILIFFFAPDGRRIAFAMVIAAILHFAVSEGLFKHLLVRYFHKVRPYIAHPEEIISIGSRHSDSAFPSSHTSANLAVLAVLAYFYPNMWIIILSFGLLVAFARLHNGMHYLSDVFFGAILGTAYGAAAIYLVKNYLYVLS